MYHVRKELMQEIQYPNRTTRTAQNQDIEPKRMKFVTKKHTYLESGKTMKQSLPIVTVGTHSVLSLVFLLKYTCICKSTTNQLNQSQCD